jgi:NAD(P)-dependent dehydrogenase (short-subunit alcohol dehydrogenase family)
MCQLLERKACVITGGGQGAGWAFSKDAAANDEREKIINDLY